MQTAGRRASERASSSGGRAAGWYRAGVPRETLDHGDDVPRFARLSRRGGHEGSTESARRAIDTQLLGRAGGEAARVERAEVGGTYGREAPHQWLVCAGNSVAGCAGVRDIGGAPRMFVQIMADVENTHRETAGPRERKAVRTYARTPAVRRCGRGEGRAGARGRMCKERNEERSAGRNVSLGRERPRSVPQRR